MLTPARLSEMEAHADAGGTFQAGIVQELIAHIREMGEWQDIATVPTSEDEPFLVRLPGNDMCKTLAIQVSIFEGNMYPDCKDGIIDWEDRITNADAWMPLPPQSTERNEA